MEKLNKKFKKNFFLIAITMLSVTSGCASYNATALGYLSNESQVSSNANNDEIIIAAKKFSKFDCKRFLDRDVINEGYQPVQIYIQNGTNKTLNFSLDRVSLAHADPEEVAKKVHTSTIGRITGYGLGALLLWPLAIPAVVDGIKSSKANKSLDVDFYEKSVKNQTVKPYSYMNGILFVPKFAYDNNFSVTLIDSKTSEPITISVTAN